MELPRRNRLPHHVPPWVQDGCFFLITICCAPRGTNQLTCSETGEAVLKAAGTGLSTSLSSVDVAPGDRSIYRSLVFPQGSNTEWHIVDLPSEPGYLAAVARADRPVQVQPACEDWGFAGHSLGFQASYPPGPVTMTHVIQDPDGWRLLVSTGEILDTPPMKISETSMVVKVDRPVKQYFRELMKLGFSHHCIAAPGQAAAELESFAEQREKVLRLSEAAGLDGEKLIARSIELRDSWFGDRPLPAVP